MDVSLVIRRRLKQLGLGQKDLASATQVTESYISQLLTQKKAPPAPQRTDIYVKMGEFLKLPSGELAKLADLQRQEDLKRKLADPPVALFQEVRELVLQKCKPDKEKPVRAIFERQPFGVLERLVTQKLLDVVKGLAQEELHNEEWVRLVGRLSGQSYQQMRVTVLELLDTDVLDVSIQNSVFLLDPVIESWDIDLATFGMEVVLNRRVARGDRKEFEFVEKETQPEEPGLEAFLQDASLNGDATEEEIEFLRRQRFKGKRPTPLYYYRALQNLRDPLHFHPSSGD